LLCQCYSADGGYSPEEYCNRVQNTPNLTFLCGRK
jgi:hypothetical protein